MDSRREFLKKISVLSGGASISRILPESILRALAIDPAAGSTFLDAEHIVLLMQENRSFDHCFGTLKGVRGFNDPRAITLPDGNPVWLQSNPAGETYAPFRLNFKGSKVTWMGSLPHSRESQIDAWNGGKLDNWLEAKKSDDEAYARIPLTMGHYTREDIPFYYDLADAFTVCDQHFCASLTPTSPNRLFFWTGTVRAEQNPNSKANVRNEDIDYGTVSWKTYPERLEEAGVSWKVYQNDISVGTGLTDEQDAWLSNFGDNPLEYFRQYYALSAPRHIAFLQMRLSALPDEIQSLQTQLNATTDQDTQDKLKKQLLGKQQELEAVKKGLDPAVQPPYDQLSESSQSLHQKALTSNDKDPLFQHLDELHYKEGDTSRSLQVPAGDVLSQFRTDVNQGQLPAVSWIVAPQNLSDHPSAPWYGAWYVSEVLDILTKNPEVWKKTIFLLTYDENDGYFDHVPPFVAPRPGDPDAGEVSRGLDTGVEYVTRQQELAEPGMDPKNAREGPVGLGYRVPLVIASPWTRGGWVCSQVFDHSSSLQFLEHFLQKKWGKQVREDNISAWRRTVSGDLVSAFRPYSDSPSAQPLTLQRDPFLEEVYNARFKKTPSDYRALTPAEIGAFRLHPERTGLLPVQEKGIKPSCALPYQLYADGSLGHGGKSFSIRLKAANEFFGKGAAGAGFNVYAPGKYQAGQAKFWAFALSAGDSLVYSWPLKDFENGNYLLRVYGPNGFFREYAGGATSPGLVISCDYTRVPGSSKPEGNLRLDIANHSSTPCPVRIIDHMYGIHGYSTVMDPTGSLRANATIRMDLTKTHGWYDFTVESPGHSLFRQRYAGRVESGLPGFSDPVMGGVKI